MSEKEIMNVLGFQEDGIAIFFITKGRKKSKCLMQMPGQFLHIKLPNAIWKYRTMKMPFETYKKKYLKGESK